MPTVPPGGFRGAHPGISEACQPLDGVRRLADSPLVAEHDLEELRISRVIETADAERRDLERVLHDGLQQQLVAVSVNLQLLDQLCDTDPVAAKVALGEIRQEVRDALKELRQLAERTYPTILGVSGLAAALRAAGSTVGLSTRVVCSAVMDCPQEVLVAVYFCCRAALEHAADRGGADSEATIGLRNERGALVFEIADVPQDVPLHMIQARLAAVGGVLEVLPRASRGSTLKGTIPLSSGAPGDC